VAAAGSRSIENHRKRPIALQQALLLASSHARIFLLPLWWTVLQVYRVSFWLGKVGALVYKADEADGQVHMERVGIPNSPKDRRMFLRTYRWSTPCNWARLSAGAPTTVTGPNTLGVVFYVLGILV
jgi:hypothetical protein